MQYYHDWLRHILMAFAALKLTNLLLFPSCYSAQLYKIELYYLRATVTKMSKPTMFKDEITMISLPEG